MIEPLFYLMREHGKAVIYINRQVFYGLRNFTATNLNITESSASKHLKLLYDLGFIDFEEKHPEKFYFLSIKEMEELFKVYDKIVEKMKKNKI